MQRLEKHGIVTYRSAHNPLEPLPFITTLPIIINMSNNNNKSNQPPIGGDGGVRIDYSDPAVVAALQNLFSLIGTPESSANPANPTTFVSQTPDTAHGSTQDSANPSNSSTQPRILWRTPSPRGDNQPVPLAPHMFDRRMNSSLSESPSSDLARSENAAEAVEILRRSTERATKISSSSKSNRTSKTGEDPPGSDTHPRRNLKPPPRSHAGTADKPNPSSSTNEAERKEDPVSHPKWPEDSGSNPEGNEDSGSNPEGKEDSGSNPEGKEGSGSNPSPKKTERILNDRESVPYQTGRILRGAPKTQPIRSGEASRPNPSDQSNQASITNPSRSDKSDTFDDSEKNLARSTTGLPSVSQPNPSQAPGSANTGIGSNVGTTGPVHGGIPLSGTQGMGNAQKLQEEFSSEFPSPIFKEPGGGHAIARVVQYLYQVFLDSLTAQPTSREGGRLKGVKLQGRPFFSMATDYKKSMTAALFDAEVYRMLVCICTQLAGVFVPYYLKLPVYTKITNDREGNSKVSTATLGVPHPSDAELNPNRDTREALPKTEACIDVGKLLELVQKKLRQGLKLEYSPPSDTVHPYSTLGDMDPARDAASILRASNTIMKHIQASLKDDNYNAYVEHYQDMFEQYDNEHRGTRPKSSNRGTVQNDGKTGESTHPGSSKVNQPPELTSSNPQSSDPPNSPYAGQKSKRKEKGPSGQRKKKKTDQTGTEQQPVEIDLDSEDTAESIYDTYVALRNAVNNGTMTFVAFTLWMCANQAKLPPEYEKMYEHDLRKRK